MIFCDLVIFFDNIPYFFNGLKTVTVGSVNWWLGELWSYNH
jgi:hypothetical protein